MTTRIAHETGRDLRDMLSSNSNFLAIVCGRSVLVITAGRGRTHGGNARKGVAAKRTRRKALSSVGASDRSGADRRL